MVQELKKQVAELTTDLQKVNSPLQLSKSVSHVATPHAKDAEDRLKREKTLIEPAKEWHFHRLLDGPQGRGYKKL